MNPARDLGPRIAHAILPIAGKGSSDWGYAEQTTEQITLSHLRNLIQNMKLTAEQAMDALDVPAAERPKYAALIG